MQLSLRFFFDLLFFYLFYGLQLYHTSLILARYLVIAVACRIFWYSLTGVGIRVHERLITSQSKGQFTDYCAGKVIIFYDLELTDD